MQCTCSDGLNFVGAEAGVGMGFCEKESLSDFLLREKLNNFAKLHSSNLAKFKNYFCKIAQLLFVSFSLREKKSERIERIFHKIPT